MHPHFGCCPPSCLKYVTLPPVLATLAITQSVHPGSVRRHPSGNVLIFCTEVTRCLEVVCAAGPVAHTRNAPRDRFSLVKLPKKASHPCPKRERDVKPSLSNKPLKEQMEIVMIQCILRLSSCIMSCSSSHGPSPHHNHMPVAKILYRR